MNGPATTALANYVGPDYVERRGTGWRNSCWKRLSRRPGIAEVDIISVFSSSRISTSGDIHALNRASPERAACELPAEIPDHVADELRRHNGHQRNVRGLTERDSSIDFLTNALTMWRSKSGASAPDGQLAHVAGHGSTKSLHLHDRLQPTLSRQPEPVGNLSITCCSAGDGGKWPLRRPMNSNFQPRGVT